MLNKNNIRIAIQSLPKGRGFLAPDGKLSAFRIGTDNLPMGIQMEDHEDL